jgi:hypothetical protein
MCRDTPQLQGERNGVNKEYVLPAFPQIKDPNRLLKLAAKEKPAALGSNTRHQSK